MLISCKYSSQEPLLAILARYYAFKSLVIDVDLAFLLTFNIIIFSKAFSKAFSIAFSFIIARLYKGQILVRFI